METKNSDRTETAKNGKDAKEKKKGHDAPKSKHLPKGMEILYEDKDIIVVDKDAGLLTIATAKNKFRTAHCILNDYVRKGCAKSKNRVFVVHRLDQGTSGVLMFAKSEEAKNFLQDNWKDTTKKYLAVIHGCFDEKDGVVTSYLIENKALVVYSTKDTVNGKIAHTAYKVIKEIGAFSMVELTLLTGRKNQIRVHMADKGHPVVGDGKYGKGKDGYTRLALHARSISFTHPTTGKEMTVEAKIPSYFDAIMKKQKEKEKEARQKSVTPQPQEREPKKHAAKR